MVAIDRAATARREPKFFGASKWKPAGSLPGRAARGQSHSGSTPSLCPCVSRPPTRRPTDAAASSICIANAWCCGARCAACAWRSICRSRRFAAWRSGCTATPVCLLKIPRRHRSPSCSSTPIRLCRCRCLLRPRPTTSSPNGSPGAACSGCRCWSPKATASCANRSRDWARCASKLPPGGADAARQSRGAGRRGSCAVGPANCRKRRWSIAASARSSQETRFKSFLLSL